jgi:hypothetical protein
MSGLPQKCVIDTNVPKTANLALNQAKIPQELKTCVRACVEAMEQITTNGGLVLDVGDEIFTEYLHNLTDEKEQQGWGNKFVKWVFNNRWTWPNECVAITKNGASYNEFPNHNNLANFDNADRKFIAVANAHPGKPPILQATDCKWWGWKDALAEAGITVRFLCSEYVKKKHGEKMSA